MGLPPLSERRVDQELDRLQREYATEQIARREADAMIEVYRKRLVEQAAEIAKLRSQFDAAAARAEDTRGAK